MAVIVKGWFHPSRLFYRILIMVLACSMTIGPYMGYDSIGALSKNLEKVNINSGKLGVLIGIYSAPNVVLAFFGGVLCDLFGYNKAGMGFIVTCLVGSVIIAGSSFLPDNTLLYIGMLIGRFTFGAGSESLIVAQTLVLSKWFSGKELAMSFGMALTFGRFGSILSFWTLPPLATRFGLPVSLWFAALVTLFSLLITATLWYFDAAGWHILHQESRGSADEKTSLLRHGHSVESSGENSNVEYKSEDELDVSDDQLDVSDDPISLSQSELDHESLLLSRPIAIKAEHNYSVLQIIRDIGKLPFAFWLLVLICMLFYGSALAFTTFSTNYLTEERDISEDTAARLSSLIYWASMVLSPILGWFADIFGHRVHLLIFGSGCIVPTFLLYAFTDLPPWLLGSILGFSYSLIPAALWPSIPLLVPPSREGSAFGILYSLYNLALFVSPIVFGLLKDWLNSWKPGLLLYASFGVFALICSILLYLQDHRVHDGILQVLF